MSTVLYYDTQNRKNVIPFIFSQYLKVNVHIVQVNFVNHNKGNRHWMNFSYFVSKKYSLKCTNVMSEVFPRVFSLLHSHNGVKINPGNLGSSGLT